VIEGGRVNTALHNTPKQKTGLWWKILLALLLFLFTGLFIALFILSINLNSIAHTQINRALNTFLIAGGMLDNVDIQLTTGQIDLSGLTINSPEAFGTKPLLKLNSLHLNLSLSTLLTDEIAIDELALENVSLTLVRNAQGDLSILNLIPSLDTADIKTNPTEEKEPFSIPAIHINSILFDKVSLLVIDQLTKKQWTGKLDLNLKIEDLYLKDLISGDILTGKVAIELSKLKLDQPIATKGDKLLSFNQLTITSNALDFSAPALNIEHILLNGLHSSISVQSDGTSNIDQLQQRLFGNKNTSNPKDTNKSSGKKNKLPTVLIKQLEIKNSALNYRNEMITETPLVFPLNNIQVNINQLRLFDMNTQAPPASVTASFQLEQPNELPSAYFGVLANIGTIGIGVPQVNAQIRMTGLKLDTLGTLITPAMRRTLGATGMDVGAALALDAETIKLQASAFSDEGIHYNAIKMQGPLSAPSVEMSAILSGVYSRVSDGIFNFGKGGLSAGSDIALGGVNVVKSVGGGAISIGKNLGKSLFEVGEGLVTWDKDELIKGLDGSSIGTINLTAGSVAGAGSAAKGGLKESASELRGAKTVEAWDSEIQVRYDINIKQAKEALSNMPYPPVTY